MKYYPVEKLNKITDEILRLMPPLGDFFRSDQTISGYSRTLYTYKPLPMYQKRQQYFKELLGQKIKRLFNDEERHRINIRVLSTEEEGLKGGVVDHHGILNHPVLVGVNIVPHFFRMFDRESNGDIITFATGNIPLNDPFHRRGFMVGGKKVNVFPKKDKNKVVFGYPLYEFNIVESLIKTHQWKYHAPETQKFLQGIDETIKNIDITNCRSLGDQLTKINFHLWPKLFAPEMRDKTSNLISIEYDDIVIDYLIHVP